MAEPDGGTADHLERTPIMADTSSEQYSTTQDKDTERLMDSKGGAGTFKPGREAHAEEEMTQEERRHLAEVGNTKKMAEHQASGGSESKQDR
jgi:hypothetical protein